MAIDFSSSPSKGLPGLWDFSPLASANWMDVSSLGIGIGSEWIWALSFSLS